MDSSSEDQNPQNRSPRGMQRVLVADDEHVIADTLRTILHQSGFEAVAVYDGQDAVDTVRVWPPDIFLTDVMMPGVNGIEAAIRVRKMIPTCHVLLFSGDIGTRDLRHKAHLVGNDFEMIDKPIHPNDLLVRLRALPIS